MFPFSSCNLSYIPHLIRPTAESSHEDADIPAPYASNLCMPWPFHKYTLLYVPGVRKRKGRVRFYARPQANKYRHKQDNLHWRAKEREKESIRHNLTRSNHDGSTLGRRQDKLAF